MSEGTILITGGAGYIGSVLVDKLLTNSSLKFDKLIVLDNLLHNQTPFLNHFINEKFEFVRGDVNDSSLLRRYVEAADVIIPLAAIVGFPACDAQPDLAAKTNVAQIETILKYKKYSTKIIYPNTNSGYGIGAKDEYCTEETPLNPISLYGQTKCDSEKLILKKGGVALRLATVFGVSPRMRLDLLVNDFTYKAFSDKYIVLFEEYFRRNYIHVRDVANVFIKAIQDYKVMAGEVYNVGLSNANLTKMELAQMISEFVPLSIKSDTLASDPDKRDYLVSNAKLESLGWEPQYTLEDGIKELLAAYRMLEPSLKVYSNS